MAVDCTELTPAKAPKRKKEDPYAELKVRAQELAAEHQLHPQHCYDILRAGGTVEQWKEQRAAIVVKRKKDLKELNARKLQAYRENCPLEISWLRPHKESESAIYFHTVDGVEAAILHALNPYQYITRSNADTPAREVRNSEKLDCLAISSKPSNGIYHGVDVKLRVKGLRPPKKIGQRVVFPQKNLERAIAGDAELRVTLYDGSICLGRVRWAEAHSLLLYQNDEELFVFKHGVFSLEVCEPSAR